LLNKNGIIVEIEKARKEDADWIDEKIKIEFPYTDFTPKKIIERMNNQKYLVLIARQENILTGFADVEFFLEKKEARLNAIYIDDAWRGQKIATKIVKHIEQECEKMRLERLFLLVRTSNEGAKELYKKSGFSFEKIHDKIIDGEKIEVWGIKITPQPAHIRRYVS